MSTLAANPTEIGQVGDLKSGEMKKVNKMGHEILLARVGDTFYAAENRCRHMGGNLSAGKLEGTIVTCPLHGSQYDLTGRSCGPLDDLARSPGCDRSDQVSETATSGLSGHDRRRER